MYVDSMRTPQRTDRYICSHPPGPVISQSGTTAILSFYRLYQITREKLIVRQLSGRKYTSRNRQPAGVLHIGKIENRLGRRAHLMNKQQTPRSTFYKAI